MKRHILTGTLAVSALVSGFLVSKPANAMSMTCTTAVQNLVSPRRNTPTTMGCEVGSSNNDSEAQVNADTMFDAGDWTFLGKDEDSGALENEIGVDYTPGGSTSGTWDISDLFTDGTIPTDATDIMLVLKGSGDYVGYLLFGSQGTWSTPFTNNKGNPQAVSHMSLYYRTGDYVPTPALLPGLIGMGVAALRKGRKDEAEQENASV